MIKLLLFSGCYIKLTLHLTMYSVHRANIVCQNSPRSHDDDDDGLMLLMLYLWSLERLNAAL